MHDLPTLAVLSQAWAATSSTDERGLLLLTVSDGFLEASDVAGGGPSRRHRLPADSFRITQTTDLDAWEAALRWLESVVGTDAVVVVDYEHELRDLILFGSAWLGMRYCLRFSSSPPRFSAPIVYSVIGNAEAMLFDSQAVSDEFHRNYFAPYSSADSLDDLREQLAFSRLRPHAEVPSNSVPSDVEVDGPIRVLIAAYFSGPCRTVGVQRPNYWFEELTAISGGSIEPHIVSTTGWGDDVENVHVVPDFNVAALVDADGTYPDWSTEFVASEKRDAKSFNTLSYYWRYALERYFDASNEHFDVVIISGNPFSCFDFAAYAKRRWNARVVLDYRDPFGNNPRFNYSQEARIEARYAERGFNFQADMVCVVNDFCVDLVEPGNVDAEVVNIPNGYDERILSSVERVALPSDRINLVHAGSFTHDRSPQHILRALDPQTHTFHHVGNIAGVDPALMNYEAVVVHGRRPYPEALGVVGGADIGVVFLSEENFETTTKLFDYLAMGIDILLCTNGEIGVGAVADVLAETDGVYWCKNTQEDAVRFIDEYRPHRGHRRSESAMYSRRDGTELLAARIADLAKD